MKVYRSHASLFSFNMFRCRLEPEKIRGRSSLLSRIWRILESKMCSHVRSQTDMSIEDEDIDSPWDTPRSCEFQVVNKKNSNSKHFEE